MAESVNHNKKDLGYSRKARVTIVPRWLHIIGKMGAKMVFLLVGEGDVRR